MTRGESESESGGGCTGQGRTDHLFLLSVSSLDLICNTIAKFDGNLIET